MARLVPKAITFDVYGTLVVIMLDTDETFGFDYVKAQNANRKDL